MNTQGQHLPEMGIYKAHTNYNDVGKNIQKTPVVNTLIEWHKKMMPDYTKAEVWLDDSIEPLKLQDCRLSTH
jgi:hypothetical protein